MELSDKTARELYEAVKANPARAKFGFGNKAALINIDVQKAYTRTDLFKTAYENDPNQIQYINELAALMREKDWPVIWTYVAYVESGEDCGVWGTRTDTPDSLQNIKYKSERSEFDDRIDRQPGDIVMDKKMPSPFFETNLQSLLIFHQVDTLLITGGSTSGCVRAMGVDSLSRGYRTTIVEECVADKHESYHFANLTDLALKYCDVESVGTVKDWLRGKN
ncbi:MAG: isochorismatase family protein [Rhodospirillaceae bacterium]|jgi:maleamate amidohydrolase|nr:isochorismatase family protein [Rhodospirillaceae bacterium]